MIKDWNVKRIKTEIDKICQAEADPREDGFVTWSCKQELYELLWTLEDKVNGCSTYEGEQEFIKKRRIKKMMKVLSK
jgi:hypothetical protein